MASKRVSLKGRGADIFFGEEHDDAAPTEAMPRAPEPAPANGSAARPSSHRGRVTDPMTQPPPTPPHDDPARLLAPGAPPDGAELDAVPASVLAGELAGYHHEFVDRIRKTVRAPGREVSFVRLTPAEKARLADIVYIYKRRGWKTSENEINRIAVNYLLADYEAAGELSLLAKVLTAIYAS